MTIAQQELMTRSETAEYLRCGLTHLWMLDKDGALRPSLRLGRMVLYRQSDVERFVERMARKSKAAR